MNDFFSNLIGRHLGTCDTVQPRTLGRFEVDRGGAAVVSPEESANPVASLDDQTLQPPGEAPYVLPKETASETNPLESTVVNRDHLIDPLSAFSAEIPNATLQESNPFGNSKVDSSQSHSEQGDPSAPPGLTEQQAVHSDSQVLIGKRYETQPSDTDNNSHLGAIKQEQQEQPNKIAPVTDEHDAFSDRQVQPSINESHETTRNNSPPPASRAGEHYLENELIHRTRTLLRRLADDPVSPITEPAPDDRDSQNNESLISTLSEKKAPLLDAAVASLDPAPTLEQQTGPQDRISTDNRENTALSGWLETPSWLPEIEAQIGHRLQEIEANAEPVINVTIGRVEVRAVQTEATKKSQQPKKPTGVMTLDDYLKRREGRGSG